MNRLNARYLYWLSVRDYCYQWADRKGYTQADANARDCFNLIQAIRRPNNGKA